MSQRVSCYDLAPTVAMEFVKIVSPKGVAPEKSTIQEIKLLRKDRVQPVDESVPINPGIQPDHVAVAPVAGEQQDAAARVSSGVLNIEMDCFFF